MNIGRKILAISLTVGVSLGLVGCNKESNSTAIASIINSYATNDISVESSDLGVTFHRNIILGTSIDIGGSISYEGIYSDELKEKMVDTIESVATTSDVVANIDRGTIEFEGSSGSKKMTSSEAYYGDKDKKLTVQDVLDDLDSD